MRTPEQYEEGIAKQRVAWKDNFERRWAQVEYSSARAKLDFQKWLVGFRPEPYAAPTGDTGSVLSDHIGTTSTLWAVAAVLLSVWTLGMVSSITLDGGIHLAFAGAMVMMVAAWLRRTHHRQPVTVSARRR